MSPIIYFFLGLCAAAFVWNVRTAMLITQELERQNLAATILVMRYMPWRFLKQYRKSTIKETGTTGSLYYHYVASLLTILVTGLAMVWLLLA